jgi:hypothetical protein
MKKIVSLLMMAILSGCIRAGEEAEIVDSNINLNINEPSADYVRRHSSLIKVNNRPPGVHFYVARWDREKPGTANFDHGENAFSIENILSITAVEDSLSPQEGLVKFNVNAALAATDLIGHDEARKRFLSVLQTIRKAGWHIFIDQGDPRLRGQAMLNFALSGSSSSSLDADYEPTFAEWMSTRSNMIWQFYANHVYLTVSFSREPTLLDPQKPGAYLISFTIESENEHYRGYVPSNQRAQWKSALPSHLEYLPGMRQKKEDELRAKGIRIDETYQNPPIPNLNE